MDSPSEQLQRARTKGGAFRVGPGTRIRLSGADALRYLNGQVTRDLKRLGDDESLPACILTPKGKLCAAISIHREGEDLIVESSPEVGEALLARLERYLVADDVVLTPEAWVDRVHAFGPTASAEPWSLLPGLRLQRLGAEGRDVPAAQSTTSANLLDPAIVEIFRIERGIPAWGSELGPETLPPEAGLDRTHIDYDRGCYPGQEVISRLKSIGRVNRLLHGFHAAAPLAAGMEIHGGEGGATGRITSAAKLPGEKGWIALGYLPRGASGDLFVPDPLTGERTPLSITAIHGT